MKKMVENSTINEIIKGVSVLVGGVFGGKILDYFIQRNKKKEEKNKEVLLESLKAINTMWQHMNSVIDNTPADRFLILVGHNSGNIPNPMHPYYSKVIWQKTKDETCDNHESLIRRFDSVKVDGNYVSMIIEMLTKGSVKLRVSEMPDSFLKRAYLAEGIKYSEVYFLKQEKTDKIYYCSIATIQDNEYFDKAEHRTTIELAVNHIDIIFKDIN